MTSYLIIIIIIIIIRQLIRRRNMSIKSLQGRRNVNVNVDLYSASSQKAPLMRSNTTRSGWSDLDECARTAHATRNYVYHWSECKNRWVLSRFLKVHSVDAVRMSGGKLFHASGPATLNARFTRCRLVRGTTRSPRAAERRAERVETVDTGTHKSCM